MSDDHTTTADALDRYAEEAEVQYGKPTWKSMDLRTAARLLREAAGTAERATRAEQALDAIDRTWYGYTFAPHDVSGRVEHTRLLARGQAVAVQDPDTPPEEYVTHCGWCLGPCLGDCWASQRRPDTPPAAQTDRSEP